MSQKYLFAGVLLLGAIAAPWSALSQAQPQVELKPVPKAGKKQAASATSSQQHGDRGQEVFEQNCSRCHWAPEGFSPRISGTIVRHMRVRASLSQQDEEALLRFFNP
jgi:cytochrome c5